MGFVRFLKSFSNYDILAEDVITLQIELYNKYKLKYPEIDSNDILFHLWRTRFRQFKSSISKITKEYELDVKDHFGYSQTALMSVLDYPKNVRFLGLFILKSESFEKFMNNKNTKYNEELELYKEKINELIENNQIMKEFRKINPNYPFDDFYVNVKYGVII